MQGLSSEICGLQPVQGHLRRAPLRLRLGHIHLAELLCHGSRLILTWISSLCWSRRLVASLETALLTIGWLSVGLVTGCLVSISLLPILRLAVWLLLRIARLLIALCWGLLLLPIPTELLPCGGLLTGIWRSRRLRSLAAHVCASTEIEGLTSVFPPFPSTSCCWLLLMRLLAIIAGLLLLVVWVLVGHDIQSAEEKYRKEMFHKVS